MKNLKEQIKEMLELSAKLEKVSNNDWDSEEAIGMRDEMNRLMEEGRSNHHKYYSSLAEQCPEYMIIHYMDEQDFNGYTELKTFEDGYIVPVSFYAGTDYIIYIRDDVYESEEFDSYEYSHAEDAK